MIVEAQVVGDLMKLQRQIAEHLLGQRFAHLDQYLLITKLALPQSTLDSATGHTECTQGRWDQRYRLKLCKCVLCAQRARIGQHEQRKGAEP